MHRISTMVFLVSSLLFSLLMHSATLTGTITTINGTPLSDAAVFAKALGRTAYTNKNGFFEFKDLPEGTITIHVKTMGFVEKTNTIQLNAGINTLDFILEEWVEALPEILVNGNSMIGGQSGLKNIAGSSTYISPRELARFTNTDPMRVLRNVPGIIVQEEDGFGLRPNIGMRGTGTDRSSKITIMEDGILAAPAPYSAPAAYYYPNAARMSGVEVIKGSSTIKYGPFTTGGVINYLSSPISSDGASVNMRVSTGSYNTRELYAQASAGNEVAGISIEGLNQNSDGFKTIDGGAAAGFDKNDFVVKARVTLPKLSTHYTHNITAKAGYNNEVSLETYTGLNREDFEANAFRRYVASENDRFDANHQQYSGTYNASYRQFNFAATVYNNTFTRNWYKLDKMTDDNGQTLGIDAVLEDPETHANAMEILRGTTSQRADALQVKANNRSYISQGIQFFGNWKEETATTKHVIEVGARLHRDQMDQFQWVDLYAVKDGRTYLTQRGTPGTANNSIDRADAFSAFLNYSMTYGKISVIPGIRYEQIEFIKDDYGKNDVNREGTALKTTTNAIDAWIPGIGFTYQANSIHTLFAGVHKGFSPPGAKEGTNPESSVNYELGWRATDKSFHATATFFANDYTNLLGSDLNAGGGAGTNELFNAGSALVAGLEFAAGYDLLATSPTWAMPVTLIYSYTYGQFNTNFTSTYEPWGNVTEGDLMPYLPQNQLSAVVTLERGRFSANLNPKYTGKMRTVAGSGSVPENQNIPANLITDLGLSYRLFNQMVLFANVRNLTNETYLVAMRPAGLRPGMPRMFIGGIKLIL